MIYKITGIEKNTSVEFEKTDDIIKLVINKKEIINLSYEAICDLSNLLNGAKDSIFDNAAMDLGY